MKGREELVLRAATQLLSCPVSRKHRPPLELHIFCRDSVQVLRIKPTCPRSCPGDWSGSHGQAGRPRVSLPP